MKMLVTYDFVQNFGQSHIFNSYIFFFELNFLAKVVIFFIITKT